MAVFEILLPQAITGEGALRLIAEVQRAIDDPNHGTIVFGGGTAGFFCEGIDLKPLADGKTARGAVAEAVEAFARCLQLLRRSPKPTIALVDGIARGGGLGLAAECDVVVATDSSCFALPELLWGLLPTVIYPSLRQRISIQQYRLWALTGRSLTAAEARDCGLVDEVIPPHALEGAGREWQRRLARVNPEAVTRLRGFLEEYPTDHEAGVRRGVAMTTEALTDERLHATLRRFYEEGRAPWESA